VSTDHRASGRRPAAARRRSRRLPRALAALAAAAVLAGCSGEDLALPRSASDNADYYEPLWLGAWIASGVVGVFVFGLMVWAVLRYRRRSDDEIPAQTRYNLPIEVLYTIAPVIIVAVFFFHTIEAGEEADDSPEASEQVLVVGQKWSWSFNYLEQDGAGGQNVYTVGTPADRPTLYLPEDTTVEFELRSQDVIHAFWVPAFYFKLDVVPGRENTFTLTTTEPGTYEGRCSELCGIYHSRMLFTVEVVDRATFDDEMAALEQAGNVGIVEGSSATDDIAGVESEGSGEPTTEDGAEQ